MIPTTEAELDIYFKLQLLFEAKRNLDRGLWHFGSSAAYNCANSHYEQLKKDYLDSFKLKPVK